jgi:hypothetical protein
MKIQHYLFGMTLLAGLFVGSLPVNAYFTTSQSVRTFNATSSLFAITYTFGSANRDIDLPIMAVRDSLPTLPHALGYTLLDSKGSTSAVGTMRGVVLSKAPIVGDRYHIKAGESASFTFVTLLTTPPTTASSSYKVRVTALPFTFTEKGKVYENGLNPSELQYYTTPASLGKPGKIVSKKVGTGITINYSTK